MLGIKSASLNPYLDMSEEDIRDLMAATTNPEIQTKCKAALDLKSQPEAFITVEFLRNTRSKAVGNSYRVQGKLVKAYTKNYTGELTFGFGDIKETAKIGIFVMLPDYVFNELSFAQGQHVTFKVAFSEHPTTGTAYVLQAGTIPTLKKDPVTGDTLAVWTKGKKEVIQAEAPDGTWERAMSPVYSEVTAQEVINTVTVNMASVNTVVPTNPLAWLKESEAYQQSVDAHNLSQWNNARLSATTASNPNLQAVAEALQTSEEEVKV